MFEKYNIFVLLYAYIYMQCVYVEGVGKSSLVFVIDDTYSMSDEIRQVKEKTYEVFDAVLSSNGSAIDEFVLVTFNDPDTELRIVTTDKDEYKNAVNDIVVNGGDDCEEYAMSGIELALENSKPNSFLYVFTDASAKDYEKFERVKSLSQKKSTQITFLLTGLCDGGTTTPDYLVFEKLSEATSGQVFNIERQDVNKVIDYIIASIKHKKSTLTQKTVQTGDDSNVKFTVDSKIWDVIVSVSSGNPECRVIGPDGAELPLEIVTKTDSTSVAKLNTIPGNYTIILNNARSIKPTSVIVTGSTSVTFQHGFSTFKPSTINETSTRPIPDEPSILSIELDNISRDVLLNRVELRDENDNMISELPLKMVNEKLQFYTTEKFDPPKVTFKIWIYGTSVTGEKITRAGATTVEYQKPTLIAGTTKNMAPKVTILEEDSTVYAEFDKPLTLYCKVTGYPKPEISWLDGAGAKLPSTINAVELPYEYVSILEIATIQQNETVTCEASNSLGQDSSVINITILNYLNVIEYPSNTTIEYGATKHLTLKIDAFPPAMITWYKGDEVLGNDDDYQISEDGLALTVKEMLPKLAGSYGVIVYNDNELKQYEFNIIISGLEPPVIDKTVVDYYIKNGTSVDLSCRVLSGKPEPIFFWSLNQNDASGIFDDLPNGIENTYHIERVSPQDSGIYRCLCKNDVGIDIHDIFLFVEYPPVVEMDEADKIVKQGDLVQLPCSVKGAPSPSVRWLVNGLEIAETSKYKIYRDNTLSFRSTIYDAGVYTCDATNLYGNSRHEVRLDIYVPVKIDSPKQSIIELDAGNPLMLTCQADGYPKPEIAWTFFSKSPKIEPKILEKDATNSFVLENVQIDDEGIYTCVATNSESIANITYEVIVRVAPEIVNITEKVFEVVKGDLVLRIPCQVTGSPAPKVSWQFANGWNIVTGSEWYDVEKDGTLIIKNADENSANKYVCLAENSVGVASETFEVIVDDSPTPDSSTVTVLLEEGSSRRIVCGIDHKKSDLIRWFKDGRNINISDLVINNAQVTDAGIYSCRVSNFVNSHSSHTKVVVGYKPTFTSDEETNVEFNEGSMAALSCNAEGQPKPRVSWWKKYQYIAETSMDHIVLMKPSDIGEYTCAVNNEFGTITRTFNIISTKECVLNTNNNFESQQPLLLSSEELTSLRSVDGLLRIQATHNILMICPNTYINVDGKNFGEHLNGTCVDGSVFDINGNDVDFTDIKCNDKIAPLARSTSIRCGPGNTQLLNIGYNVGVEFIGVYDVCIERRRKRPLYAKHDLYPFAANAAPNGPIDFMESRYLPFKFDDMYNCHEQRDRISALTGKRLSTDRRCCFAKRQLVNPKDVIAGYQQLATYNYLNVIPKWGTCGSENWDDVEERVRNLVKALDHPLEVYTGSSHLMKLPAQPLESTVHLTDRLGRKQLVPRYIWKVIINHFEGEAIAIVQINVPDITVYQAFSLMLCKDICHEIEWMRSTEWRNVKKGFTFCCNVKEFEAKFGYKDVFKIRELNSKVLIV